MPGSAAYSPASSQIHTGRGCSTIGAVSTITVRLDSHFRHNRPWLVIVQHSSHRGMVLRPHRILWQNIVSPELVSVLHHNLCLPLCAGPSHTAYQHDALFGARLHDVRRDATRPTAQHTSGSRAVEADVQEQRLVLVLNDVHAAAVR